MIKVEVDIELGTDEEREKLELYRKLAMESIGSDDTLNRSSSPSPKLVKAFNELCPTADMK